MKAFTAYFDASGSADTPVLTIAGFVSRAEKWARFEEHWKSLLPPTVTMFHMTDFVSSRKGWERWKGVIGRRIKLIDSLFACIKANTNQGFTGTIKLADYKKINGGFELKEKLGQPYAVIAMGCLGRLKKWAEGKKIDWRKILCVFEEGDHGQGDLIARARAEGYNAVSQSNATIRAFDTCDLAAWKARVMIHDTWERRLYRQDADAVENILRSLGQLETIVRGQEVGMYSPKGLTKICELCQVPKR